MSVRAPVGARDLAVDARGEPCDGETAKLAIVADHVRLTVVSSQGEADVICSLLRAHGIKCAERAANISAERGGGFGGWREVLVLETDLPFARDLVDLQDD